MDSQGITDLLSPELRLFVVIVKYLLLGTAVFVGLVLLRAFLDDDLFDHDED